jgi:hypothetical protein
MHITNATLFFVKTGGIYYYHCAWKSYTLNICSMLFLLPFTTDLCTAIWLKYLLEVLLEAIYHDMEDDWRRTSAPDRMEYP